MLDEVGITVEDDALVMEVAEQNGREVPNDDDRTEAWSQDNRNTSKSKGRTLQGSLLKLWMDENASQQSNKKLLTMMNLQ